MPRSFIYFVAIWGILLDVSVIIELICKKKKADAISKYPIEKKKRVLEYHSKILKIDKLLLWIAPFQLIIIPYLVFTYAPSQFANLMIIFIPLYIYVLADFYYKRSILKLCQPE